MQKNSIKELVRTKVAYAKGSKAIKKAGGVAAARKKLAANKK